MAMNLNEYRLFMKMTTSHHTSRHQKRPPKAGVPLRWSEGAWRTERGVQGKGQEGKERDWTL